MSCRQIAALLDAFLDGELPAEQMLAVEEHLAACEGCGERLRFGSALRTSTREAVEADARPSAGFETRLSAALRAERERMLGAAPSLPPPGNRQRRWMSRVPMMLAAAATFSYVAWIDGRGHTQSNAPGVATNRMASMDPEEVLEELVSYHTTPPAPQITEPALVDRMEPEVGVPVHLPSLKQYGASWEGGSVIPIPVTNQRAAILRFRMANHSVTVYVYDTRRVRLRGVLEPRVVHNQPVHVGERHGYSIAALEHHGVGHAIASDLDDDESAELVASIY